MRRFAWVLVFAALIAALLYAFRAPLSTRLLERVAIQRMTADPVSALPDGIHVVLCGAGSPLPDPRLAVPTAEDQRQIDTVVPFRNMLVVTLAAA